ncbi:MAG: ChaN family lipoprotein [Gammaproteobacteria bacterium]|nr:ChaN family lipoprotein [Gammaproteobacteria bacterium]MCP5416412.1 ChaN family lipoprotein [Chromatiaceae bacterium]
MVNHRTLPLLSLLTVLSVTACNSHESIREGGGGTIQTLPQGAGGSHLPRQHPVVEPHKARQAAETQVLDMTKMQELSAIIARLSESRVVYVGETHDRFGHHLNQLEIIRELHRRNPDLAIGMEFFQQPFQSYLDSYTTGRSSEREMLLGTEWFDRWRFDYRLYRPIMQYAREQRIPVIALNVARELTNRVSEVGIAGLSQQERAMLPQQLDSSDASYRQRIRAVYQGHPHAGSGSFERFLEVQLTWDEGMAERVASYLKAHPERNMVVLAGSGHLMYGNGIPHRVARRLPIVSHILLPADNIELNPGVADFVLYPAPVELPHAGLMGVLLDDGDQGVRISKVLPKGAAGQAGIAQGDLIQHLNGARIHSVADIKIVMLDLSPGDRVQLEVVRKQMVWGKEVLQFDFALGGE